MKKIINAFLLLVVFFVVLSLSLITFSQKNENPLNKEYPTLNNNNVYKKINSEGFLNRIENKDTFITVFAFPSCPWCQSLLPVLDEVAKEKGLDTVYYIYLKEMRDNEKNLEHENYLKIFDIMKEANAIDVNKQRVNAPTIVVVKDGVIIDSHLDTVSSHQIKDGSLPPLNEEQRRELVQILKGLISKIM